MGELDGQALKSLERRINMKKSICILLLLCTLSVCFFSCDDSAVDNSSVDSGATSSEEISQEQSDTKKRFYTTAEVGDIIKFGSYEQDGDESNGKEPISWCVLDKQDSKMLVCNVSPLEVPLEVPEEVVYVYPTVLYWFNKEFLSDAFSDAEQELLCPDFQLETDVYHKVALFDYDYQNWKAETYMTEDEIRRLGSYTLYGNGMAFEERGFIIAIWIEITDDENGAFGEVAKYNYGDIVTYGKYEQDRNEENGQEDIEWIILDVDGDKAFVVSKYALDCEIYNPQFVKAPSWENSSIRKWLNGEFLNTAFSDDEQKNIILTSINNRVVSEVYYYHVTQMSKVASTEDKIFLLSLEEVYCYLPTRDSFECKATEFAKLSGVSCNYDVDVVDHWWTRTIVSDKTSNKNCVTIDYKGFADVACKNVTDNGVGVRPAMWIDLDAIE